jgi:hypothetical protein
MKLRFFLAWSEWNEQPRVSVEARPERWVNSCGSEMEQRGSLDAVEAEIDDLHRQLEEIRLQARWRFAEYWWRRYAAVLRLPAVARRVDRHRQRQAG